MMKKGTSVRLRERSLERRYAVVGPSVLRVTFHQIRGSGAASVALRLILPVCVTVLVVLGFVAVPALAAAPEVSGVTVEDTTAVVATPSTEAVVQGVLNASTTEPVEAGTYEVLYKQSNSACVGGSKAPVPPAVDVYAGLPGEPASVSLTGLLPDTEYTVCLRAEDSASEVTVSTPPVTFKTPLPPEAPVTLAPKPVEITATTAVGHGTLDPHSTAKDGWYFAYSNPGGSSCTEGPVGAVEPEVEGKALAEHETLSGLEPLSKYVFCMVTINAAGETAAGNELSFETDAAPPVVEGVAVSNRKAGEARLEATVNPNNQLTECHFQYGKTSVSENTVSCEPELLKGYGGQGVGANIGGLEQETVYHYRVVTKNGKDEESTEEQTFETALSPNTPEKAEATGITATTATLNGVLNPAGERTKELGTYEFVYRQSSSECRYARSAGEIQNLEAEIEAARKLKEGENTLKNQETLSEKKAELRSDEKKEAENKTTAQESASGSESQPVDAEVTGLTPGAEPYTYCVLVHNEAGEEAIGPVETFMTVAVAPAVNSESASVVEATAATLDAEIVAEGAETTYHFQYGTSASYGQETQAANLKASDDAENLASARIPESGQPALQPDTTYHYRVIATNEVAGKTETTYGTDATFTTPKALSSTPETCRNKARRAEQPDAEDLPDCRAYEMVSPLDTGGGDATEPPISHLLATGRVRASEDPEREARGEETEPSITYGGRTAFSEPAGSLLEDQVLSRREPANDRWSTQSITAPAEEASLDGGYEGAFFTPKLSQGLTETHASLPVGAAPPGFNELYLANFPENPDAPISYQLVSRLPPGKEEYTSKYNVGEAAVQPEGASSDLGHIAFEPGVNPVFGASLYESAAGHVVQVGVSNAGEDWSVNAGYHTGVDVSVLQDVWHAMSAGGSRVVFTRIENAGDQLAETTKGLYVRVNGEQEQSAMNTREECTEAAKACTVELASGGARYWGANSEDTKVFYTENGDLYEYSLPVGQLSGQATALTHAGQVQGVVQISEDGAYVYFVANADLAGAAQAGEPNLYVSHEAGEPVFIATLSESDSADWSTGPEENQAVVSPDGVYLAFTSEESLTGYDNQPAENGECKGRLGNGPQETGTCLEVYLYDAETSALVCASCNPTGSRPVGGAGLSEGGQAARSGDYRPRALLEDGALFFDSSDVLVAQSSGGRYNVYEYQDGDISPISNVDGVNESFFLDASPDGENVFFATADHLLPEDKGDNIVVWDAREDGGFPLSSSPPACENAASCQPPAVPQSGVYAPSGTGTFSGSGNLIPAPNIKTPPPLTRAQKLAKALKQCRKDRSKKSRTACEKRARGKYGAKVSAKKSTTRATNDRRVSR